MTLDYYKESLMKAGVVFDKGLAISEIKSIEDKYSFKFPPDLREFLMYALPTSNSFINWRDTSSEKILERLTWPSEGICFDIEHADFWLKEWGQRPASLQGAFAIARQAIDNAPRLIPILGHRYIPERPHTEGNPVFSVYQTDIIYYGSNLFNYFDNEFRPAIAKGRLEVQEPIRKIEFWSSFTG